MGVRRVAGVRGLGSLDASATAALPGRTFALTPLTARLGAALARPRRIPSRRLVLFSSFGVMALYALFPYHVLLGESLPLGVRYAAVVAVIAGWSWLAAGHVRAYGFAAPLEIPGLSWLRLLSAVGLAAAVLALNWSHLFLPLSWRGDEDSHAWSAIGWLVRTEATLADRRTWGPLVVAFAAIALTVLRPGLRRSRLALTVVALACLPAAYALATGQAPNVDRIARYPVGILWLQGLFAGVAQVLAGPPAVYSVLPYRLAVLVLATAAALVCYWGLSNPGVPRAIAWPTALALWAAPLVYQYSTAIYLELGYLLLAALFSALLLLRAESFLALAPLAGAAAAMKDSTLPFAIAYCLVAAARLLRVERQWAPRIWRLGRLGIVVLLPSAIALVARLGTGTRLPRSVGEAASTWADPTYWATWGRAAFDQFSPLLLLACAFGLLRLAWVSREAFWLAVLTTIGLPLAFALNGAGPSSGAFAGHPRLLLHFFPVMILGAIGLVGLLGKWSERGRLQHAAAVAVVLACLAGALAGEKRDPAAINSAWAEYSADLQGFYPYDRAIARIDTDLQASDDFVLVVPDYGYSVDFYTSHDGGGDVPVVSDVQTGLDRARSTGLHYLLVQEMGDCQPEGPAPTVQTATFVARDELGRRCLDLYRLESGSSGTSG